MPTRVIDVGDGRTARLVLTNKDNISEGAHYIALSHCWGNLTENQKKKWCTTTGNKEERRAQGFPVTELSQTFQDAIRVTRELGQRYLWIDSLCIIQGEGGDWETESKKMEAVFKNAYCTIAATSAEDSTKGFLNRPLEEKDLQYVTVPKSSHGKVYICTSIDNFDSDVVEGVLNNRAWVLQERALSRRTIHFTKRQTYWECGGGFRCETLTFMNNAKLSFQSDPEFPSSIESRYNLVQVELFQSLFTNYSKFGITNPTDRPVAIDSLAMALAKPLKTNVRHGIFESFLHRSLLWQPAQNTLTQISYPAGKAPPSWSWMAYHGPIQYLQINYGDVEWDRSVRLVNVKASDAATSPENNDCVLEARVRRLRNCKIKPEGAKRVICGKEDNEVGQLWFDTEPEVWCAIMGRETGVEDGNRKYYVLFVTECMTPRGRGKFGMRNLGIMGILNLRRRAQFRRVGMGSIQQRFILFDGQDDTAQIF